MDVPRKTHSILAEKLCLLLRFRDYGHNRCHYSVNNSLIPNLHEFQSYGRRRFWVSVLRFCRYNLRKALFERYNSQKNNQFTQITTMCSYVIWKTNLFLSSSFEYKSSFFVYGFVTVFFAYRVCLDLNTDRKLSIRALYPMSFFSRKNKNIWINVILFKLYCLWYIY